MIRNSKILKDNFVCGKFLGEYLQKHNVPLLNIDENKRYYFRRTKYLKEALEEVPFWISMLERIF